MFKKAFYKMYVTICGACRFAGNKFSGKLQSPGPKCVDEGKEVLEAEYLPTGRTNSCT